MVMLSWRLQKRQCISVGSCQYALLADEVECRDSRIHLGNILFVKGYFCIASQVLGIASHIRDTEADWMLRQI